MKKKGVDCMKVRDLTRMALCVALTAVCAWINIPTTVPFTLQTFAVFMTLGLLGGRNGTLAILAYLLLGAVGVPVFSGFRGGLGALAGSTGGYLVGFLGTGLIYWAITAGGRDKLWIKALAMVLGLTVTYALGTVWFQAVSLRAGKEVTIAMVLGWCVWPFIVPDVVKLGLGLLVSDRLKKRLDRGEN